MRRRRGQAVTDTTTTVAGLSAAEEDFARGLMDRAKAEGVSLVGPGGLLSGLTKTVLETALEAELTEDLGYEAHEPAGRNSGNSRNGTRSKTVLTEVGPVEIDVPRDRNGTFEPKLVRKRQRRMTGVDDLVISLVAKGLTTGEVCAHLAEIYGAEVTRDTVSRITDRVLEGMAEWQNRPLDRVYPVLFIDAIHVKIRDGAVANRPIYTAVGVTTDGERDILGLWAGTGVEGAKFWLHVLTEIKNRGVADVCIVVCDGLTGLPDAIEATWPRALTQTCVIHLLRINRPSGAGQREAMSGCVRLLVRTCRVRASATRPWRAASPAHPRRSASALSAWTSWSWPARISCRSG